MLTLEEIQKVFLEKLSTENFISAPHELYKPIQYILDIGGKRIRPSLCMMAEQMFTGEIKHSKNVALGIEIFHNFTLLHDDIMDNAPLRRNQPTVHEKWNDNTAILSGDAMLIKAYQFISNSPSKTLPKLLELFNKTALEVCEGQQYDMDFEQRENVTVEEYLKMIHLKTAALLAASLKSGAILGEANENDAQALYDFGINIGLSFQLQDDYLDTFGDEKVFGKTIGGDIVANKKTYLLINALEKGTYEQKKLLKSWINASDFDQDEKIQSIKSIYLNLKLDELSKEKMDFYYKVAIDRLNSVSSENKYIEELKSFAKKLMNRSN